MRLFFLLALAATAAVASAQEPTVQYASAERGPRFLFATPRETVALDVLRTPALRRRVSMDVTRAPLREVLDEIARQAGLSLAFSPDVVNLETPVTLEAKNLTVAAALTEVLIDLRVDVVLSASGQLSVVRQPAPRTVGAITGTVTESATGNAVPQAQVSVSGHSRGATTAEDGRYTIEGVAAGSRTVTVRRLGYEPISREVNVSDGGSVTADFALLGATTRLAEIVTTVTGTRRRVELGNAIGTINSDSLTKVAAVRSFNDLLMGRTPGVISVTQGAAVGKSGRVRIRGINSTLISNDPVIVIDGVRVEGGVRTSTGSTRPTDAGDGGYSGRLGDINPSEIASVEVVKGPSAATLYGTDAANGVIVIQTKRGLSGRHSWNVFAEQGQLSQKLDLRDNFPDGYYAHGRNSVTNAPQRCLLTQRAAGMCVVDSITTYNTFFADDTRPFGNGSRQQFGLNRSGGGGSLASYFVSIDHQDEVGTTRMPSKDEAMLLTKRGVTSIPDWQKRPNQSTRTSLRGNASMGFGQRGTVSFSNAYLTSESRFPAQGGFPYRQIGYRDANDGWGTVSADRPDRPAYQFARKNDERVKRYTGSLAATQQVRQWISVRATLGADLSNNSYGSLFRRGEYFPASTGSTGDRQTSELTVARYSVDLGASANRTLTADWNSRTSAGAQYNRRVQRGAFAWAFNLPLGGETLTGGTLFSAGEATFTTAVAGGYFEEAVDYKQRLFVTGAVRMDAGSAFGRNYGTAMYPKASVSYVVGDGSVGLQLPGLDALRLRAAYGSSGVQPGTTDAIDVVTVTTGINTAGTGTAPIASFTGGNPDLKPERSTEVEAGFDAEFIGRRVRLEATAYERKSKDALVRRTNATSVGGSRVENLGSVRNRGLELQVSADIVQAQVASVGFASTASWNSNKLLVLGQGIQQSSPLTETRSTVEGYPLFGVWGYVIESINDANGDGIIVPAEFTMSTESRFLGSRLPEREATFSPYLRVFKDQLQISGMLQYRGGFMVTNQTLGLACVSVFGSFCREVNDPTTSLEDQARAQARAALNRFGPLQEDGSYLAVREVSAAYTLPASMVRRARAQSAQLVLAGRNVALPWKASNAPFEAAEVNSDGQSNVGLFGPGAPTYWVLRMNLTF